MIISVAIGLDSNPTPGQLMDKVTGKAIMIKHVVISCFQNKFLCDGKTQFDSIVELLNYYNENKISMMPTFPNVVPQNAILRQPWELRHSDVEKEKKLGEGAFGEVYKGTLILQPTKRSVDVAIKLAKTGEMTKEKIKEMMNEARLMRNYDHPNVVKLYGVCVEHEPLMIVMELINGGGLDAYLKKFLTPMEEKVENMVCGVAWGLDYLHHKNCIHRDIAARNCLYANHTVKISDFGLSREGTVYQMKVVRRVPIKWLAPETIQTLCYSQKTDVWSFGILVFEIFSNGDDPYSGMTNSEVKEKVLTGYRMELPPDTPPEIARLVASECWSVKPELRPTMRQIVKTLEIATGKAAPPGSWSVPKVSNKAQSPGAGILSKQRKKKKRNPFHLKPNMSTNGEK
ncbi:hypothetical protein L596_009396 [Steinernema carpocapsae]|uniref:Protein kinase domain-containing protein n=1 Tax=Steinernema carpocapsae TaxID=34508 RepID=A0A4U5PF84_STECR|nr:hypothetical protein L596_009396 [Steinernema carpocapsae]